jgi:two-component sensor histidine kinase
MFGYTGQEVLHLTIGELFLGISPLWLTKPLKMEASICEWVARRKDHSVFDAEASAKLVETPDGGRFVIVIRDISGTKRLERDLRQELLEKETLLKEVHHRIKNNLVSIETLLSMQAEAIESPEAASALHDATTRVSGIRILYEKLLVQNDYVEMAGKEYVETLMETICSIHPSSSKLVFHKDIQDFSMDAKRLLSLGIVINELLGNSLKYAFTDRASGAIHLVLHVQDDEITLSIHDNGRGFPDTVKKTGSSGFGLPLVSMICHQLGGSFASVGTGGTLCIVKVPRTGKQAGKRTITAQNHSRDQSLA